MKKYLLTICTVIISCFLCVSALAAEEALQTGVYTLKNKASGQYMRAFDMADAEGGYAYTAAGGGKRETQFLLVLQEDGSYLLYPQSEEGKYALTVVNDMAKEFVSKSEQVAPGSYFHIKGGEDGYTVSTLGGYSLGVSDGAVLYRKTLVLAEEQSGEDTQKWEIAPVRISSFELKMISELVNVNSVSAVYAVIEPAYMKNFISWSSSDESILMIDKDGSFCALSEGTAVVTATLGDLSRSMEVTVVDDTAFVWYSQHNAINGGWHASELNEVYFYSGSLKRYIIDKNNKKLDWMDQGCYLSSVAMVLRNMGARLNDGYDFRFDASGALEIDPYTTSLANSNNYGLTTSGGTLYGNPILVYINRIMSNVTLYGQKLVAKTYNSVTKESLKAMLDKHPEGVIVWMSKPPGTSHYIVVTKCLNPNAKPEDYRFQMYDSASYKREKGNNVPFEQTISYSGGYRFSNMIRMHVFDFVPESVDTEE